MHDGALAQQSARLGTLQVADLFCGAGGSSTAAMRALASLGYAVDLVCVNHWPVAVETHRKNHPNARHFCQDLATVRPRVAVPGGRLDLLMASPTCTFHSRARGGRPTSDQQRMDPWHVIAWLAELQVASLFVENVPEFVDWGPVDPVSGRPIKERKGKYFRAWAQAIEAHGMRFCWAIVNAANHGDATTRQRFFGVALAGGATFAWPAASRARRGAGGLLPWVPARDIIDWSIRGRSIFSRKKPLAANTLLRIHAGVQKFRWPEPFLVILRNHMAAQSIDLPVPTIAARGNHVYLAEPQGALPFVCGCGGRSGQSPPTGSDDPIGTVTAKNDRMLIEPFMLGTQSNGAARNVEEPVPTITTGGAASPRPGCARPILIEPVMLSRQGGGAPRAVDEPTPCQVAKHSHVLIAPYYGQGSGESCSSGDEPLPTVTAKARFGLVTPITHSGNRGSARSVDDPLPTITTAHRGELAFVTASFGEREAYDILYRMLEPHELAAAMGFSSAEAAYEFCGTKTDKVRQIGNAVPVNTAAAIVAAIFAAPNPARAGAARANEASGAVRPGASGDAA